MSEAVQNGAGNELGNCFARSYFLWGVGMGGRLLYSEGKQDRKHGLKALLIQDREVEHP